MLSLPEQRQSTQLPEVVELFTLPFITERQLLPEGPSEGLGKVVSKEIPYVFQNLSKLPIPKRSKYCLSFGKGVTKKYEGLDPKFWVGAL